MQTIQVGTVLKPRGLRGELKCTMFPPSVSPLSVVIADTTYTVAKCQTSDFTYLTLATVDTLSAAETLRGKPVFIDRAALNLAPDEILASDLVGFAVVGEDGDKLGSVASVDNFGAGDIIDCGSFAFPYEDEFVVETNITTRRLVVRPCALDAE